MGVNIIYKMNLPTIAKREIQINVEWDEEQYKSFATFPDAMIEGILATEGLCDLELSEDGREVVSFTELEMPDYMKEPNPTPEERIAALEEENAMLMECLLEMSEIVYA